MLYDDDPRTHVVGAITAIGTAITIGDSMTTVSRGTLSGMAALVMWSALVGLIRSVTDAFGVAAGTALIYTAGAAALLLRNGVPDIRRMPKRYVFGVGLLFVVYEIAFSRAIGMAETGQQTLEVGMLNYLWPCLTVLFSMWIVKIRLRWLVWPGTALAVAGLYMCIAANGNLDLAGMYANLTASPAPYALGLTAGIAWALYCNLSVVYAKGNNAVPVFFVAVAVVLWIGFFANKGTLHFPGYGPLLELLALGAIVGFSYSMWETGIHDGNFILLAVCSYLTPAASTLFSAVWLKTMPPLGFWLGVALVIAGSLLCWSASTTKSNLSH